MDDAKIDPRDADNDDYLESVSQVERVGKVKGSSPRDNQTQNRAFQSAVQEIGRARGKRLKLDEERKLHEAISGQGLGYQEIIEIGKNMFPAKEN